MFDRDAELTERSTLTEWEWVGLHKVYNLSDGHSHFTLSKEGQLILANMANVLQEIDRHEQDRYEQQFLDTFFTIAGQSPPATRPMLHYSCSTSIDLMAKVLAASGVSRVAVLTPSFDNVAQLLARANLFLSSVPEDGLIPRDGQPPSWLRECDALFIVCPNNPTGWRPTRDQITRLTELMARAGKVLMFDCSFRFYSDLDQWDLYAHVAGLEALDWAIIEDTGKTWPLAELKVGFVSASARLSQILAEVTGELLLSVSPFVLELLRRVMLADVSTTPGQELHARRVVSENRRKLREAVACLPILVASRDSSISVEWLRFERHPGVQTIKSLLEHGLAVLPGGPFYWNDRRLGDQYFRIALARDTDYFGEAIPILVDHLTQAKSIPSVPASTHPS